MSILGRLVEATEAGGNFSIEWNEQRGYYETVKKTLEYRDLDFESNEMRDRAIRENTLVVLQWYPKSPVSFAFFAAPDLESLFSWLDKVLDKEPAPVHVIEKFGSVGRREIRATQK